MSVNLAMKPGIVGATICLHSGVYFDYLNPTPEMISIEDIAWGLSNICRYGGQCQRFYSVAQHSVIVADMLDHQHQFQGLMHDAAEAYVGDMVGPLKQLCPDYKVIEKRVEAAIAKKFGLPHPLHPLVKVADLRALNTEKRDLTSGAGDQWNGLEDYPPLPERIIPWEPEDAYEIFFERFEQLSLGMVPA